MAPLQHLISSSATKKMKAFFNKRKVMFRLMFYTSFILIIASIMRFSNNVNYAKNITPVFFLENEVYNENMIYSLAGVVKPGTFSVNKGTDELKFIITDYEHEILVLHKGIGNSSQINEGSTVVVTGSIVDKNKPDTFVSTKLISDHAYNGDAWISKFLLVKIII